MRCDLNAINFGEKSYENFTSRDRLCTAEPFSRAPTRRSRMFFACAAIMTANSYLVFDRFHRNKLATLNITVKASARNVPRHGGEKKLSKRKHHRVSRNQISNTSALTRIHVNDIMMFFSGCCALHLCCNVR